MKNMVKDLASLPPLPGQKAKRKSAESDTDSEPVVKTAKKGKGKAKTTTTPPADPDPAVQAMYFAKKFYGTVVKELKAYKGLLDKLDKDADTADIASKIRQGVQQVERWNKTCEPTAHSHTHAH